MGRQVLLFVEVFMTSVMSHGRALLRATTPEALQEVQAAMTAGLTVCHLPMHVAMRALQLSRTRSHHAMHAYVKPQICNVQRAT